MKTLALTLAGVALACGTALYAEEPMKPSGVAQALMSDSPEAFFETAASANMFEIESSKLALERSKDPGVRKFAQMMVSDHTEAGKKVSALAATKSVTLPTAMLKRHQMMLDGLKDEKAGKDFDDEYRLKMVVSHKEAVSLFDESARESKDPDIKKLAGELLPKLQMHGAEAQKLRDAAKDAAH